MTVRKWFLALVIFFVAPIVSYASDPGDVFLHLIEGDVQMATPDTRDWVPAASNTPLFEGDKLWVPYDGRAEIRLNDGTSARLGYGAALEIGPPEEEGHHFYLDQGRCYVNFPGSGGQPLTIDAPDASIRAYGAAVFKIDAPEDGETVVSVLAGALSVGTQAEQVDLRGGERLTLRDRGAPPDVARLAPDDEWGRWNRERDGEAYGSRRGYSAQYLPEGLRAYAPDFDRNGTWEQVPQYGRVWVPAAVVSPGWSPYRIGRWVWMRGDYVWVSYEPWGWAPYHYGRWAYVGSVGWCWVPPGRGAIYWAPGYVGWVYTGTLVSWVPLAPREIYYGRGYHGPDSVDTSRANDRRLGTNITYRNVHVKDGVTTINRDAFLTGRGAAPAQARENPFLKERPSYGAPPIKPVRTTLMPIVRDIPPAKRPPERIREAQSLSPAQNEHRKGPVGPAPLGQKGPGPAAPSEQKKIGSPIERPPSTGPVAPSGQQGAPASRTPEARQGTVVGQPGRETMGGSVGGQPPRGRPGIAPRQGQAQVSGPSGQGTGTSSMKETPQAKPPELQRRTEPAPAGPPQAAPQTQPKPIPQPAPQTQPKPAQQPAPKAASGGPPQPAPQIQAKPMPQPTPQAEARPMPQPAPQAQPKPMPQPAPRIEARPNPPPAPQAQPKPAPQPPPAPKGGPGMGQPQPKGPGAPADKGQQSTQKREKEGTKPDQKGQGEGR